MSVYAVDGKILGDIAEAIREKTGKGDAMTAEQMPEQIRSISGGSEDVPFVFGGMNATRIASYEEEWGLEDTTFKVGETAPSAATAIKAAVSNRFTSPDSPNYNFEGKDIVVHQYCNVEVDHDETADKKAQEIKASTQSLAWFSKRKTADGSEKTYRQVVTLSAYTTEKYYNTNSVVSRGAASYGIYGSMSTPTVASATSDKTYVRASSPTINARVSTTYEKAENMKKIRGFRIVWHVDVYVVDPFTTLAAELFNRQEEWLMD